MRKPSIIATIVCALMLGSAGISSATTIFSDNFDSENGGKGELNYTDFANWTVLAGAGIFVPVAGNYTLSFQLAGNHVNNDVEAVTAQLVGYFTATYSRTLYLDQGNVNLIFSNLGGDNIGGLLNNITVAPVPEPGAILLLGGGLLGLAIFGRKKPEKR